MISDSGKKRPVLVTGANGFVGTALVAALAANSGLIPIPAVRRRHPETVKEAVVFELTDVGSCEALFQGSGVDVVMHLAAHVHQPGANSSSLEVFRAINVEGTLNLARQAAAAGVRRFIYLSSVKVNGELSQPGRRFTSDSTPLPKDPYGISKYEAEIALVDLGRQAGMEVVIVRPPLVYGPGVKANFEAMLSLVDKGVPLPFGNVRNRRSLIYLPNLIELLVLCIDHPQAPGHVFFAADRQEVSTADLLRLIGQAMEKPARLFTAPEPLIRMLATLFGQRGRIGKLYESLLVDWSQTRELLGWEPTFSLSEGLEQTVRQYLDSAATSK